MVNRSRHTPEQAYRIAGPSNYQETSTLQETPSGCRLRCRWACFRARIALWYRRSLDVYSLSRSWGDGQLAELHDHARTIQFGVRCFRPALRWHRIFLVCAARICGMRSGAYRTAACTGVAPRGSLGPEGEFGRGPPSPVDTRKRPVCNGDNESTTCRSSFRQSRR